MSAVTGILRSERGFSLPEVLLTILIVGVTATAILGGMLASTTVSSQHRSATTADTVVRSAAEWVKDPAKNPYISCASAGSYSLSGLSIPTGFSATISRVEYWDYSGPSLPNGAYQPSFRTSCPATDQGLQRITVVASAAGGQATETVMVLKRVIT
jgi:prepilin-type N-terminal cleavage/methylation domain-containing protein